MTEEVPEVAVAVDELRDDFEAVFDRLGDAGDLVWLTAGGRRLLLVNAPAAVREVLIERSAELVKPRAQTLDLGPPQPEVVDERLPVAAFRRAVAHGLSERNGDFVAAVADAARLETREWVDGATVAPMPVLRRIAIRATCRGLFASEPTEREIAQLEDAMRWFDDQPRVVAPRRRLAGLGRKGMQRAVAMGGLALVVRGLTERADRSRPSELTAVVNDLAEQAPALTDRDRASLVGELLIGAAAPFAQTAGWLLVRFATERAEAEALRAEWDEALVDGVAPAEAVVRLKRTAAFVREVTRFHPTNPRITRVALVDTHVGGEDVPAATRVILNVRRVNGEPSVYPEPERFDPSRWLDTRPAASSFAYVSFGLGERRCLGEHVGVAGLAALLPALARDRELEAADIAVSRTGRRQLAEDAAVTVRGR